MGSQPFWESVYRDGEARAFGAHPTSDVAALWEQFNPSWSVLDVGCGEGRNALFLAGKGMSVDAFDISEAGIARLEQLATESGVTVNGWVQDLAAFQFSRRYDLVLCHGVLHLLERPQWVSFIEKMQENTSPGGMNLVGVFTNRLPPVPDLAPFMKGLFNEGELEALYSGWDILLSREYEFEDDHPGGIHHRHAAANIAARKPL